MREDVKRKHFSTLSVRPRSVLASRPLLLPGEDFGFNAWSVTECDRDMNRSCWSPWSDFMPRSDTIVAKLRKPAVGFKCQSGRRRRAVALASVRRSNCTCRFPAYSFHVDAHERGRDPSEGIREMRFTKPNSSYSITVGNCIQPRVRHRRKRCDQMRRTIQPSSLWKSVRTWARL
jgi:hypothetical protein